VLECINISKSFGSIKAAQGVSIRVEPGEVRAVVGGNGSGKSTLARVLGGVYKADSGQVLLDGKELALASPSVSRENGIVTTSQELSLLSNLTVFENLLLCDLPTKGIFVDRKNLQKKSLETLASINMTEYEDRSLLTLAANQLYMLEFGKALIQEPRVLIIDEITSALFRENVETVKKIIFGLREKGCITLFITHRINEVYDICDSVSVMRNGQLVATHAVKGLDEIELLSEMTGRDMANVTAAEKKGAAHPAGQAFVSVRGLKLPGFGHAIDLDLAKEEIVGIAGLQGNGQSNLVRTLFALFHPVTLKIDRNVVNIKTPQMAVHNGFAFVSGDREKEGTYANRSVLDNLAAVTDLVLHRKNMDKERTLTDYGVVMKRSNQLIRTLSGGNQQKVVLARWTTAKPKFCLLDDPTKGIDVNARRDMHRILWDLAENGTSILFVSSDEEELVELTRGYKQSRVIIMYAGEFVHTLVGDEITVENIMLYEIPRNKLR
jgi:ribose transport system ATP-binding protein